MRPADRAWASLFVAVTAYEITASRRDWELLSEAVDRYRRRTRIATDAGIVYLALHLLRRWPTRVDPLTMLARTVGR